MGLCVVTAVMRGSMAPQASCAGPQVSIAAGTTDAAGPATDIALAFDATLPTALLSGAKVLTVGTVQVQVQVDAPA